MLGLAAHVNVYTHPRLSTVPLIASPTYLNMNSQCPDMQVADLITPSWTWNVPLLASLFSADTMTQICAIPLAHELLFGATQNCVL